MSVPAACVLHRFWSKVEVQPNGCWHWTGTVKPNGYGRLWLARGVMVHAHRLAYELFVGPIPDGKDVGHTCHDRDLACVGGVTCEHRLCVNPAHLAPMPRLDNLLAGRTLIRAHHDGVDCGFEACPSCQHRHRTPALVGASQ